MLVVTSPLACIDCDIVTCGEWQTAVGYPFNVCSTAVSERHVCVADVTDRIWTKESEAVQAGRGPVHPTMSTADTQTK